MTEAARRLVALLVLPQVYNPDGHGRRRRVEDEKFRQEAIYIKLIGPVRVILVTVT